MEKFSDGHSFPKNKKQCNEGIARLIFTTITNPSCKFRNLVKNSMIFILHTVTLEKSHIQIYFIYL